MEPQHRLSPVVGLLFAFLIWAVGEGAAQEPPNPVLLDVGPVLEIEDEDVPIGACQVEVDCPDAIALGQEGLCRVHVLQKVADDAGEADFEERKVPPGIWRQVWPPAEAGSRESAAQTKRRRAFAWKIDVSRVLRGWRCIQTRDEEPFTLGNRFRIRPDFCPAIVYVGAHPLRYFPLQPESGIPYACELREEPVEEPALVCNLLRDLEEPDGGTLPEELGCVGELLIKACQVRFDCPPPIVPPTPTPTAPFITPPTPPFVTPPTPTPSITPTPTPSPTPTLTPSPVPTLPIYQEPGRVVPRTDGPHALEMHGRIQANPATFDPNDGGVTWQFWVGGQKLVDFAVPAGAFRAFAGGVYRYSGTGARVVGGIEYLNFHDISVGGTPGKAVSVKGYSDTLDALVELPAGVASVEARFTLITSVGTFSSSGPMRRGPGGIWRMDFPSHGGIAPP